VNLPWDKALDSGLNHRSPTRSPSESDKDGLPLVERIVEPKRDEHLLGCREVRGRAYPKVSLKYRPSLSGSKTTVRVALPILHCYRCVYSWTPKSTRIRICLRCKSPYWNVPLVRRPPYKGGGLGIPEIVAPRRKEILALVRKHRFTAPRVFGSVARGGAGRRSDLDLLVRYRPHGTILDRANLEIELRELLHRPVDVVPEGALKWYAAPEILAEAVPV
jgi:uncharacterized protein